MYKKSLRDEELLLLSKMGDGEAEQLLLERYFLQRFIHGRKARPDLFHFLSPLDYNSVFFRVYLIAFNSFRFGVTTFHGYLQRILDHEIIHEVMEITKANRYGYKEVPLDTLIEIGDGNQVMMQDVIADDSPTNDPKAFLEYAETLASISKLPKSISKKTLSLMRLHYEGYTFEEAGRKLSIPYYKVKTMVKAYRDFVKFTLSHGSKKKKSRFR